MDFKIFFILFICFKIQHHLLAACEEPKAWHVWVLRDVFKRTKQFKTGLFTTWRKTSMTTLLWRWSSSLYMNSLFPLAPLCAPALLRVPFSRAGLSTLRASSKWAGRSLVVFLAVVSMLCSGSHWKVSTANSGKTSRFYQVLLVYLVILNFKRRQEPFLVFHSAEIGFFLFYFFFIYFF